MIDLENFRRGLSLLNGAERRTAAGLLALGVISALTSAAMVGSIFPFLAVLSDPSSIETTPGLAWVYAAFGFSSHYAFVVALGVASLAIIVIANALQMLNLYLIEIFCAGRGHAISERLLARYLQQPYEYFLGAHSDTMSARILTEVTHLVDHFYRPAIKIVASLMSGGAILALLLWVNAVVAGLALSVFGGAYLLAYLVSRRIVSRLGDERTDANQARFRITKEALAGIKGIKVLGREDAYHDRYLAPSRTVARNTALVRAISTLPRFVIFSLSFGGLVLVCLYFLEPGWLDGTNSLGSLLPLLGVFAFAAQRLIPELQALFMSLTELQYGVAVVERIHSDFTSLPEDPHRPGGSTEPLGLSRSMELRDVRYVYPGADRAGLHGINLTISAGERIGIVGSTGAGKTTLVDLILCLLHPQSGQILVDGAPLAAANCKAWQRSVGYVPQDIFLADASIAENIALGIPPDQIDMDRVRQSARIAELEGFVTTDLPDGYQTEVGDRGVRLSGGQRQRIGVARAFYHDADLIVFDEATSALDNLTEQEVMKSLNAFGGTKTVLIVAHRLSTIRECDRIIVMKDGRIDAIDTFQNLSQGNATLKSLLSATG
ncbi:MAG: ABC transporter ATP-binding protein/permease [Alphaproteobacteria bacterium]|nr:ABC transporter ATP-binding protein/permease [Alphaproteobacteria bacterium]NNF24680.1 ABC transporter ATP-binding protein [Paracoccaceae bacterium]